MHMWLIALKLIAGLVLLVVGGDTLVRGSVSVAQRLGVSALMIGLVLVGFGTSMPELVTSINAALAGSPDIAIGNVVGSNIANVLLILGVAALLAPVTCEPKTMKRDGLVALLAAILAVIVFFTFGMVGRVMGAFFFVLLIAYIIYVYRHESKTTLVREQEVVIEKEVQVIQKSSLWVGLLLAFGGIAITVLGADLLVESSIVIARQFGVSEAVIGLTVIAIGTSLPELITAIMASIRKHADIVLGNVLGSNIYNVLCILGVTAMIKPIAVSADMMIVDMCVMIGAMVLLGIFGLTGKRLSRLEGGIFLAAYIAYISYLSLNTGLL